MEENDLFSFTKQERRGLILFFICAFLLVYFFKGVDDYPKKNTINYKEYYLDTVFENDFEADHKDFSFEIYDKEPKTLKSQIFNFNPNTVTEDSLKLLGFNSFAIKSLINFRSKGGKITDMKKLKNIYGVDSLLIDKLQNYIDFKILPKFKEQHHYDKSKPWENEQKTIVELNSTDSLSLVAVPKIGSYLSSKILKFRKKLGGYLYVDQLRELSIIPDSIFVQVQDQFVVNSSLITKIDLNKADYKILVNNPVFDKSSVTAIMKYKKQHGDFNQVTDIRKIIALDRVKGELIQNYLKVEK